MWVKKKRNNKRSHKLAPGVHERSSLSYLKLKMIKKSSKSQEPEGEVDFIHLNRFMMKNMKLTKLPAPLGFPAKARKHASAALTNMATV
jgi:hypothetical protein